MRTSGGVYVGDWGVRGRVRRWMRVGRRLVWMMRPLTRGEPGVEC